MTDENDLLLRTASRLGNFDKVKELICSGAHPESCDGSGKTALHYASENGNLEIVKHVISVQSATIGQVDNTGCDALHWASKQGKQDVVETLIQEGADIHHCDKDGSTALHAAAMGGHEDTVKSLLRLGINPSLKNNFGKTAMYYAETFGHLNVAKICTVDVSVPSVSTPGCDNLLQNACYFGNLNSVLQWVDSANPDYTDLVGNTSLHIAAEQGHKEIVDVLISKHYLVDYPDKFGRTALQLAVQKGNLPMFDLLLSHGANINHCTSKNRTVLHYAAIGGFRTLVEKIFSQQENLKVLLFTKDTFGRSAFDYATFFQHVDLAQLLNEKMKAFATSSNEQIQDHENLSQSSTIIPIDASQDDLGSLLRNAARYSKYETMVQLLDAGTSVNSKDIKGNTPLHIAAENGCEKIVSLLISRGASINQPDEAGCTALHWASKQAHSSTAATLLLQNGADKENSDRENGYTALHIAAIGGHIPMVKTLLAHRADIYKQDKYGRTALDNAKLNNQTEAQELLESAKDEDNCRLRTACYYGHLEMVKRCIGKAQTNSTDFAGNSALHLAAQNKKDMVEIVDILLNWGFSIHKTDKLRRSALHLASRSGNCQIVKFLLSKGANVNSLTEKNRSALHYAAMGGYMDIAITLLQFGVDINRKDQYGTTAQMYAATFSKHAMESFLSNEAELQQSTRAPFNIKPRYTITSDDFIEVLLPEYFCPITYELLLNPYLSSCCGKHFSEEVANKSNEKCPCCRHEKPTFMLNKAHQRMLLTLKTRCRYKDRGCTWTGEGFDFINHLEEKCQFVDATFSCVNFNYDIPDDIKKGCCDIYTITIDENGCTHPNDHHGFSITFPPGILLPNQTITLTIGVMMYGPFKFPDNVVPVSPILWVSCNSSDVKLLKNAKVVLPHCLDIDEKDSKGIEMLFMKAHVNHHCVVSNKMRYIFESMGNVVVLEGHSAALFTSHFCCICLAAEVSNALKEQMEYCITFFQDNINSRCVFGVTYLLKTCIKSLKEQYKDLDDVQKFDFKWNGSSTLNIQYPDTPGWQLTLVKGREGIERSHLDFWNFGFENLKLKEEGEMYPPRFDLRVRPTGSIQFKNVLVTFSGINTQIEIALPLQCLHVQHPTGHLSLGSEPSLPHPPTRLDATPSIRELISISVGHLNIIQSIGTKYLNLGIFLLEDDNGVLVETLTLKHQSNAEEITCAIFQRWIGGTGLKPITWRTLVGVLRQRNLATQADEIEKYLSM